MLSVQNPKVKIIRGFEISNSTRNNRKGKREIQEKAVEMFLAGGYHATSIAKLCDALNISKPTLYWHFKSKEDLLFSIHKDRILTLLHPIMKEVAEIDDPLERLKIFIRRYVRVICQHPEIRLLVHENMYLDRRHSQWVKGQWRDLLNLLRHSIGQLQEEGRTIHRNEAFTALSLIGMCSWVYYWFDHSRPEGITGLVRTIEELFLGGILKRP